MTALSASSMSQFLFLDVNLNKCQWIFTKLCMCIDIVRIWFGIANGKILSIFDSYLFATHPYSHFLTITLVNIKGFHQKYLVCALILWTSGYGLQMDRFCQFLTKLSARHITYFHFRTITWVNINGFSPNLVCALILWRSGFGLQMGKLRQLLTVLSARHTIMVGYYLIRVGTGKPDWANSMLKSDATEYVVW